MEISPASSLLFLLLNLFLKNENFSINLKFYWLTLNEDRDFPVSFYFGNGLFRVRRRDWIVEENNFWNIVDTFIYGHVPIGN